ncbi:Sodium/calcium exchanger 1, partial [Trichinella patagoniensis]
LRRHSSAKLSCNMLQYNNGTTALIFVENTYPCADRGLLLPLIDESRWPTATRAFLYLIGLLYSFVGVAILADSFMCAVERITSTKRTLKLQTAIDEETGSVLEQYQEVLIWNPTVANLTLMALGSSAPEILLSIIEIIGNGFKAGDLGPGTIVGSAAFNLFIITAVCILSVGCNSKKRIEDFQVFCVTTGWSVFAYIWLIIVLVLVSPNRIEVWEGLLTLLFFGALLLHAYLVSKQLCSGGRGRGRPTTERDRTPKALRELNRRSWAGPALNGKEKLLDVVEQNRVDRLSRELRRKYPHLTDDSLAEVVAKQIEKEAPHDHLWYRIMAVRRLASSMRSRVRAKPVSEQVCQKLETLSRTGMLRRTQTETGVRSVTNVEFAANAYAVDPTGERRVRLKVVRRGSARKQLVFNYRTMSGSAVQDVHFLKKSETVVFAPQEREKTIRIEVCNPAQWRPGITFWVKLELIPGDKDDRITLGLASAAKIIYPKAAVGESVEFAISDLRVGENEGFARIPISRRASLSTDPRSVFSSASVEWKAENGTAKQGEDFIGEKGELILEPGVVEAYIDIPIVNDYEPEKDETFTVKLLPGKASLGACQSIVVTIVNDDNISRYYAKFEEKVRQSLLTCKLESSTWKEQFLKAVSVNGGETSDASMVDCFAHIIAFPWKVIAAFVPPTTIFGGWLAFIVALALIGLLTAIIGDLAAIFGCLVGLKDSVTAITFVALGTSLPDTFASRLAALQDKTADNAIGNINGSNSVNVFLGLGLPWFIASVYWAARGEAFVVHSGDVGFSVTIYTVLSLICIVMMMLRRFLPVLGEAELGGPTIPKWICSATLILFWFLYILLSALQAYGHISSF